MKASAFDLYQSPSSYDQHLASIIKWTLLKSPDVHFRASQFTKNLSCMNLEGDTLLPIQKWWDAIISAFWKYLSTNKIWSP